jgi:hypothetical protein
VRIDWLNDEMTEARVTKGWLWWKRAALVKRLSEYIWKFQSSNRDIDDGTRWKLNDARDEEMARRRDIEDWQPVKPLPPARMLRRET